MTHVRHTFHSFPTHIVGVFHSARFRGDAPAPLFLQAHDGEADPQQNAKIGGHHGQIDRVEKTHGFREAES